MEPTQKYETLPDVEYMDPEKNGMISSLENRLFLQPTAVGVVLTTGAIYGLGYVANEIVQQTRRATYAIRGIKTERVHEEEQLYPTYRPQINATENESKK